MSTTMQVSPLRDVIARPPLPRRPVETFSIDRFDFWSDPALPAMGATIWCLADDDETGEDEA
jgi:hypothetical protein